MQFDLRFYVMALVFLIFEVEVALFFPPATVFGWASQSRAEEAAGISGVPAAVEPDGGRDLGLASGKVVLTPGSSHALGMASMLDLGAFFLVLLVGYAYVWKRGDLDWVHAVRHPATPAETAVLSARLRGTLRS